MNRSEPLDPLRVTDRPTDRPVPTRAAIRAPMLAAAVVLEQPSFEQIEEDGDLGPRHGPGQGRGGIADTGQRPTTELLHRRRHVARRCAGSIAQRSGVNLAVDERFRQRPHQRHRMKSQTALHLLGAMPFKHSTAWEFACYGRAASTRQVTETRRADRRVPELGRGNVRRPSSRPPC